MISIYSLSARIMHWAATRILVRKIILIFVLALPVLACAGGKDWEPKNGDIIFQTSRSAQSLAIQKATKSPYSHMGIIYLRAGIPYVFEAVEPVKVTPLEEWIRRGVQGKYVVKRLRNADEVLTSQALSRMRAVGATFQGKHYDPFFEWSDDRIYCSELVWKVFKRGVGISLANVQPLGEFDLSDPVVQSKIHERWGGQPPSGEVVVSPDAIFRSGKLVTVYE